MKKFMAIVLFGAALLNTLTAEAFLFGMGRNRCNTCDTCETYSCPDYSSCDTCC